MITEGGIGRHGWTAAWGSLCGAFALHVWDEATHDFLASYNPGAANIRGQWPWLPVPVFSFPVWLAGLVIVILILSAMTVLVHQGRRWLVPVGYVYGTIHVLNATGHIVVSIAGGWWAPGVYSAPVLLGAALWLLYETSRRRAVAPPLPVE